MTMIIRTHPTYNSYLIPENCVLCTYLCWQKAKGSNMRSEINVYCAKRKTASKHVFVFMLVIICIVWNVFSRYTTSISSEQIMLAANNYLLEEFSSLSYRINGCWANAYACTDSYNRKDQFQNILHGNVFQMLCSRHKSNVLELHSYDTNISIKSYTLIRYIVTLLVQYCNSF